MDLNPKARAQQPENPEIGQFDPDRARLIADIIHSQLRLTPSV